MATALEIVMKTITVQIVSAEFEPTAEQIAEAKARLAMSLKMTAEEREVINAQNELEK